MSGRWRIRIVPIGMLVCLFVAPAFAADSGGEPGIKPAVGPVTANEESQTPKWLKFDLQVRGRIERDIGFKSVKGADDTEYLSRFRVGLRFEPAPWLHFYV